MLVDTSVWILAEAGGVDVRDYVEVESIATSPPILMELLRGGRNHRYTSAREMLLAMEMLDAPMPLQRFEEAAALYRECRDAGVTVRKSIDCLIAATALAHGVAVLHDDSDFDHIAEAIPRFQARRVSRSASS